MTAGAVIRARRRFAAGAVLLTLAAPALLLGTAESAAADGGVISVEPAAGKTDWGNIRLVTDRSCPAGATNVLVQVVGANFPTGSNAVGNSELAEFLPGANGKGMVIPLFGSWDVVADANGAKRALDGAARLTLICIDQQANRALGEMTGEVRFSKTDGPASDYEVRGRKLSSGLPLKAGALEQPYVYRYDLPPGTPGGPIAGGPTSAAEAVAAANGTTTATTGSADAAPAPAPDPGQDAGGAGPVTLVPGAIVDTPVASSGRSSGGSSTALTVGIIVLAAAVGGSLFVYERARHQPPSSF